LFSYNSPVDGWIQGLKFDQDLAVAALLGRLLVETLPSFHNGCSATVLPVPLHRNRLRERGYNQALEIARPLVRKGYRLDPRCCRRHKATTAQSKLPAASRKGNLRDAFAVTRPVEGESFLLVDDVITTGATLNELARTLKKAGAARVEARVIARTLVRKGDRR
jgi:ComF family protein